MGTSGHEAAASERTATMRASLLALLGLLVGLLVGAIGVRWARALARRLGWWM